MKIDEITTGLHAVGPFSNVQAIPAWVLGTRATHPRVGDRDSFPIEPFDVRVVQGTRSDVRDYTDALARISFDAASTHPSGAPLIEHTDLAVVSYPAEQIQHPWSPADDADYTHTTRGLTLDDVTIGNLYLMPDGKRGRKPARLAATSRSHPGLLPDGMALLIPASEHEQADASPALALLREHRDLDSAEALTSLFAQAATNGHLNGASVPWLATWPVVELRAVSADPGSFRTTDGTVSVTMQPSLRLADYHGGMHGLSLVMDGTKQERGVPVRAIVHAEFDNQTIRQLRDYLTTYLDSARP